MNPVNWHPSFAVPEPEQKGRAYIRRIQAAGEHRRAPSSLSISTSLGALINFAAAIAARLGGMNVDALADNVRANNS
jgi:hypothetical protein